MNKDPTDSGLNILFLIILIITILFGAIGYCSYDLVTYVTIKHCGIVAEVGGCTRSYCKVKLEDGRIATVHGPQIKGEKACWYESIKRK